MENQTATIQTVSPFDVLFQNVDSDNVLQKHVAETMKINGFAKFNLQSTLSDIVAQTVPTIREHYAEMTVALHNAMMAGEKTLKISPMEKPEDFPGTVKTWHVFYQAGLQYNPNDKTKFKSPGAGNPENMRVHYAKWDTTNAPASVTIKSRINGATVTVSREDWLTNRVNGNVFLKQDDAARAIMQILYPENVAIIESSTGGGYRGIIDRIGKFLKTRDNDQR